LLVLVWSASVGAPSLASSQPPADLPPPPPLPEEMLSKRPSEPPPDLPDPSELIAQLQQLEELLSLEPEKLQKLRETIEFIEKMSAEEREAMRIRLSQVTRMTGALRAEINTLADLAPAVSKSNLSQFWLAATEAERADIRTRLEGLDSGQKHILLSNQVQAFVQHRDAVFARMKETLEAKRQALEKPGD
jgi:3-dehydroquinate synthase class II